jgi:hypothetical protein
MHNYNQHTDKIGYIAKQFHQTASLIHKLEISTPLEAPPLVDPKYNRHDNSEGTKYGADDGGDFGAPQQVISSTVDQSHIGRKGQSKRAIRIACVATSEFLLLPALTGNLPQSYRGGTTYLKSSTALRRLSASKWR